MARAVSYPSAMHRGDMLALMTLVLTACGGGGGGGPAVQPSTTLRLGVADAEIGTGANEAELVVRLATVPTVAPTLLEVAIELPSALVLPATGRLAAATGLTNLDGDFVGNRFVVLCGDAQNANATSLQPGDLFRLRVQPASPRVPGTYTVRFLNLRGASRDGTATVDADTTPITATVVVR